MLVHSVRVPSGRVCAQCFQCLKAFFQRRDAVELGGLQQCPAQVFWYAQGAPIGRRRMGRRKGSERKTVEQGVKP